MTERKAGDGAADFEPQITATTSARDDRVEIRIRDNGTGIPPEVREKMFNPLFTTKPAGEGTGLGLSMSHDIIVKQHGGTIDVETEPGVFTEFTITAPVAWAAPSKRLPIQISISCIHTGQVKHKSFITLAHLETVSPGHCCN